MDSKELQKLIEQRTKEVGKTYCFKQDHNSKLPADYWFQHPKEGLTLFLVMYTQACRWSKCLGCNLPSQVSKSHVPFDNIIQQTDFVFNFLLDEEQRVALKKVILSNNGSILDEDTFSTTALIYFIAKMNVHCPNVETLSIETRPEFVDIEELEVLRRALNEGNHNTKLEIAIGFEAFDEKIRNEHFNKGLPLEGFENMVKKIAKHKFKIKAYFMQKPVPNMSEEEALEDIKNGIDYLEKISKKYKIEINMHLNPTYVARGTPLETAFNEGTFSPPLLDNVRKAVLHAKDKGISIYVGLDDEGLAVKNGNCIRKGDEKLKEKIEEFNKTQDYSLLKL